MYIKHSCSSYILIYWVTWNVKSYPVIVDVQLGITKHHPNHNLISRWEQTKNSLPYFIDDYIYFMYGVYSNQHAVHTVWKTCSFLKCLICANVFLKVTFMKWHMERTLSVFVDDEAPTCCSEQPCHTLMSCALYSINCIWHRWLPHIFLHCLELNKTSLHTWAKLAGCSAQCDMQLFAQWHKNIQSFHPWLTYYGFGLTSCSLLLPVSVQSLGGNSSILGNPRFLKYSNMLSTIYLCSLFWHTCTGIYWIYNNSQVSNCASNIKWKRNCLRNVCCQLPHRFLTQPCFMVSDWHNAKYNIMKERKNKQSGARWQKIFINNKQQDFQIFKRAWH